MNKLLLIMLSSNLLMMSCSPTNKKSSTSRQRTADSPKPTAHQLETSNQSSKPESHSVPQDSKPVSLTIITPNNTDNNNHSNNDTTIPIPIVEEEKITSHAHNSIESLTHTPKVIMQSVTGLEALELQSLYFNYNAINQILVHLDEDIQYIKSHGLQMKYPEAQIELELARKFKEKEKWIRDQAEIKRKIDESNAKSISNQR